MTDPIRSCKSGAEGDDCVAATWPDGRNEEIKGFKSESAANEWIANRFAAWLDEAGRGARIGTGH